MIDHIDAMLHLGFPSWIAGAAVSISFGLAAWSVYDDRTMRSFKRAAKRVACTVIGAVMVLGTLVGGVMTLAAIIVGYSIVTGGVGFFGAPLFIAVAVLLAWTLKTNEASVDRRDRLVTVTRRFA